MKIQLKLITLAIAAFNLTNAASDSTCKEVFDSLEDAVRKEASSLESKFEDQEQKALRFFKNHCETCDSCSDLAVKSNVKIEETEPHGYLRSQFDYLYNKFFDCLKMIGEKLWGESLQEQESDTEEDADDGAAKKEAAAKQQADAEKKAKQVVEKAELDKKD